jgi:hypothetical protein
MIEFPLKRMAVAACLSLIIVTFVSAGPQPLGGILPVFRAQ